jgi:hypothetical protein
MSQEHIYTHIVPLRPLRPSHVTGSCSIVFQAQHLTRSLAAQISEFLAFGTQPCHFVSTSPSWESGTRGEGMTRDLDGILSIRPFSTRVSWQVNNIPYVCTRRSTVGICILVLVPSSYPSSDPSTVSDQSGHGRILFLFRATKTKPGLATSLRRAEHRCSGVTVAARSTDGVKVKLK